MDNKVDLIQLIKQILRGQGISFVVNDAHNFDTSNHVGYAPVAADAPLDTIDDLITEQPTEFFAALLCESYAALISDAGFDGDKSSLPLQMDDSGTLVQFPKTEIPMSVLLLSIDRTAEKLAAISQRHQLVAGTAVSLNWLSRGIQISNPSMNAQVEAELEKTSLKSASRLVMR